MEGDTRTDHAVVMFLPEQTPTLYTLTGAEGTQAMLTALIILSLISLLVATEAEPASTPVPPRADPPLRPKKVVGQKMPPTREQVAA